MNIASQISAAEKFSSALLKYILHANHKILKGCFVKDVNISYDMDETTLTVVYNVSDEDGDTITTEFKCEVRNNDLIL